MLPVVAAVAAHTLVSRMGGAHTAPASAPAPPHVFVNPYANARALTEAELAVIRSTVPVLAEHGVTLTTMFYKKMFAAHPTLNNIFNEAHQATGMQPKALAGAVYAYAANIDNLAPILPAVAMMVHKHCSLGVEPSQYLIVGENLLTTLAELLRSAKFDEPTIAAVIAAWGVAYAQLANILITEEEKLYASSAAAPNGWRGWKEFTVVKTVPETADGSIVSFYLAPKDGSAVPSFLPGQFTTLRAEVPATANSAAHYQPRQYTLSQPTDGKTFRISVKREAAVSSFEPASPTSGAVAPHPMPAGASASGCPFLKSRPAGVVSNLCHSTLRVGSTVSLAMPFGVFTPTEASVANTKPVVLIAAGVGITPISAMLESALASNSQRSVSFLYGCHNSASHPMRELVEKAKARKVATRVFYSKPSEKDHAGKDYDAAGRMCLKTADAKLLQLGAKDAEYFICGPESFMKEAMKDLEERGVAADRIHAEMFGSGMIH